MISDVLIIGAGVIGCAVARVLSRYRADVLVLEAGSDAASGASRANSGIIHAGFDAVPGTKKARLNVRGASMWPLLADELSVPYQRNGALVLAFSQEENETLRALYARGQKNGVPDLSLLSREEALTLEPELNPGITGALLAASSAIASPYEMTYALADHAAANGVSFLFDSPVTGISLEADSLWRVTTPKGVFYARALVNCAGVSGGLVRTMLGGEPVRILPRRGQYHLLDRMDPLPVSHTIFQCPTAMGKGVLVTPTVHGNLLLGPSAEDIPDGDDTATTAEGLSGVVSACLNSVPGLNLRGEITNFAGVRAHPEGDDFLIGPVPGCENAWEAIGIESPGLSAAPAIGEELGRRIAAELNLTQKDEILPPPPHPKPFREMTEEERAEAVRRDPAYGRVICRCEVVTEAEIRAAIRRPVGARTIDGVKRRCRAGMGRCQGGFCCPRVAEILSEELSCPLTRITKSGGSSRLLMGNIGEASAW